MFRPSEVVLESSIRACGADDLRPGGVVGQCGCESVADQVWMTIGVTGVWAAVVLPWGFGLAPRGTHRQ